MTTTPAYCSTCGQRNTGTAFCPTCGTRLEPVAAAAYPVAARPAAPPPPRPLPPPAVAPPGREDVADVQEVVGHVGSRWPIIAAAIGVLGFLVWGLVCDGVGPWSSTFWLVAPVQVMPYVATASVAGLAVQLPRQRVVSVALPAFAVLLAASYAADELWYSFTIFQAGGLRFLDTGTAWLTWIAMILVGVLAAGLALVSDHVRRSPGLAVVGSAGVAVGLVAVVVLVARDDYDFVYQSSTLGLAGAGAALVLCAVLGALLSALAPVESTSVRTVRGAGPVVPQGALTNRTNSFAVAAFVLGLVGGVLAIPFGHIARAQIRRTGENGDGLAIAGLVLGYLSLFAWAALVIFFVAAMNSV